MKFKTHIFSLIILVVCFGFIKDNKNNRFEIKKDNPAVGLTLVWSLPEEQLQSIVGTKFKPLIKDGKGNLMLFITKANKYYIDDVAYSNLNMAHILVITEGKNTLNAPLSMGIENQKISTVLNDHHFMLEIGKVDLDVKENTDSISLKANIITKEGKIELAATFANKPGELKTIESTLVSATNEPACFFTGPESYIPIKIESVKINSTGQNWMTQLKLPAKPDRVGMNHSFVWDFTFMRKE